MHALLTAFFAAVFSFGHSAAQRPAQVAHFAPAAAYVSNVAPRNELAQAEVRNSYAGSACLSCRSLRSMSTTFAAR